MLSKSLFCLIALLMLTAIVGIGYIALGAEVEAEDHKSQVIAHAPNIISIGDTATKSPWDYFLLEGLVGTLGAAGGGIVGGLIGSIFCLTKDLILCAVGIGGGFMIGTVVVPIIAVNAVGAAHGVRGNIAMAFLMEIGGLVCGYVLDARLPIPLLTFIGAGYGAALGYNIGATIVEPQPTLGKEEEVKLATIIIRW